MSAETDKQTEVLASARGRVMCMDSAYDVDEANRGRDVCVNSSYCGVLPARFIAEHRPRAAIGMDCGVGPEGSAIAGLWYLEALGIPYEDVKPTVAGTDGVGYTDVTGGSRTTFATGYAAYEAAHDVIRQMSERAAERWSREAEEGDSAAAVGVDDVSYSDGVFSCAKDPSKSITFKEMADMMPRTGGPITGRATSQPRGVGGAFATHVVDVEVDPDTGKVSILRYTATQDVGTAIHPSYVEGQIQGGAVQGIGWALNEEFVYNDDGSMVNASFLDYRMPTTLDLPMIDTVLVEVPNPGHPYGVRGVGEVPIVPPPAALANAIYRATGKRMKNLPMSPTYVLSQLEQE